MAGVEQYIFFKIYVFVYIPNAAPPPSPSLTKILPPIPLPLLLGECGTPPWVSPNPGTSTARLGASSLALRPVCVRVSLYLHVCSTQRWEEGIKSSGAELRGICEPLKTDAGI